MTAGDSPHHRRALVLWLVVGIGVVVAGLGSWLAVGAHRSARPAAPAAGAAALAGPASAVSRVEGFGQIGFRVVSPARPSRPERTGCALLADNPAAQARGMMGRRDLAGYDAMVFRFPGNVTTGFYNADVPIPLSLAWFDGSGALVGTVDLAVCDVACPVVTPGVAYRLAVEVPKGGLAHLGIGPGAVLLTGGSCGT